MQKWSKKTKKLEIKKSFKKFCKFWYLGNQWKLFCWFIASTISAISGLAGSTEFWQGGAFR